MNNRRVPSMTAREQKEQKNLSEAQQSEGAEVMNQISMAEEQACCYGNL